MREGVGARLAWTAFATIMLMLAGGAITMTRFNWIGAPLFLPGLLTAAILVPGGINSGHPFLYVAFALVLEFCLVWLMLLIFLAVYVKLVRR
jgi:hypothetical protein